MRDLGLGVGTGVRVGASERERERGVWIKRKERGSVPSAVDDDDD